MPDYRSAFVLGETVTIDGHSDMMAFVTGVQFNVTGPLVRVAWINNGTNHEVWMEEFRLTRQSSSTGRATAL